MVRNAIREHAVRLAAVSSASGCVVICFLFGALAVHKLCSDGVLQFCTVAPMNTYHVTPRKVLSPPLMGWRSWIEYATNATQADVMNTMQAMADLDLCARGYCDVGLDDGWQLCNPGGGYHDVFFNPVVDTRKFPDLLGMTTFGHSLGLTVGWYLNNCHCKDTCSDAECNGPDVSAFVSYGFDNVKLDACGLQNNLDVWYDLFPKSVHIENCHWGLQPYMPTKDWCPFSTFRVSGDIEPDFKSIMHNLEALLLWSNVSRPGCWAYGDMLLLGSSQVSFAEGRTQFGAWAVLSSPLVLTLDVTNTSLMSTWAPVIMNKAAIAVNQGYYGLSGGAYHMKDTLLFLYKPQSYDASATAVLIINTGEIDVHVTLDVAAVPHFVGPPFTVEYVWATSETTMDLMIPTHDSAFFILRRSYALSRFRV